MVEPEKKRRIPRGCAWAARARQLDPEKIPPVHAGDLGECPSCDGDGYVVAKREMQNGTNKILVVCLQCHGEGVVEILSEKGERAKS